jgi:hypothetical protein
VALVPPHGHRTIETLNAALNAQELDRSDRVGALKRLSKLAA